MSEIKVNSIKGVGASTAAITVNNTDGSCAVNNTQRQGKNLIINGAMQVAQRGDTASVQNGYGGADRFSFRSSGAVVVTLKQGGSGVSPTNQGFGYSQHIDVTTADSSLAASDFARIQYRFEGQDLQLLKKGTANAQQVTLSFFVKSPKTGTHIVELLDQTNSRAVSLSYTVSSANTYEKKTLTFPADTTGTITNDNARKLDLNWYLSAGSDLTSGTLQTTWGSTTSANRAVGQVNCVDNTDNDFFITGVQLEVGSVATDFEHRSLTDELLRCQRYYIANSGGSDVYCFAAKGQGSTSCDVGIPLPVAMRASPTVTCSINRFFRSTTTSQSESTTNPSIVQYQANVFSFVLAVNVGGHSSTNNEAGTWTPKSSGLILDAEL